LPKIRKRKPRKILGNQTQGPKSPFLPSQWKRGLRTSLRRELEVLIISSSRRSNPKRPKRSQANKGE